MIIMIIVMIVIVLIVIIMIVIMIMIITIIITITIIIIITIITITIITITTITIMIIGIIVIGITTTVIIIIISVSLTKVLGDVVHVSDVVRPRRQHRANHLKRPDVRCEDPVRLGQVLAELLQVVAALEVLESVLVEELEDRVLIQPLIAFPRLCIERAC